MSDDPKAQHLRNQAVLNERNRWREWFEAIAAEPDELVLANPEAFSIGALRHRQDQARAALREMGTEMPTEVYENALGASVEVLHAAFDELEQVKKRLEKWEVWFPKELVRVLCLLGVYDASQEVRDDPEACLETICDAFLNLEGKLRERFEKFGTKEETDE